MPPKQRAAAKPKPEALEGKERRRLLISRLPPQPEASESTERRRQLLLAVPRVVSSHFPRALAATQTHTHTPEHPSVPDDKQVTCCTPL
jgi:hypothetical protein